MSEEHVPVDAARQRNKQGNRTFEIPADVCAACSDFESGRLVPVAFCAQALAAYDELYPWARGFR